MHRPVKVCTTVAEPLGAKVIGSANICQARQSTINHLAFPGDCSQGDYKAIATVLPPPQFPGLSRGRKNGPSNSNFVNQGGVLSFTPWPIETEPLACYRMSILETAEADIKVATTRHFGQFASDVLCVIAHFLQFHTEMLSDAGDCVCPEIGAAFRKFQHLVNNEIAGRCLQTARSNTPTARRGPVKAPLTHESTGSSRQIAWQAMPSPRPVKPSFSVVVAFTLTRLAGTPRSSAMFRRMASI